MFTPRLLHTWLSTVLGVCAACLCYMPDATAQSGETPPAEELGTPQQLHFADVMTRARSAPPSVQLALQNALTARAQLEAAKAQYLPRIVLEGQYGVNYRDQPIAPPPNLVRIDGTLTTASGTVSGDWLVTDFGARRASIEAAQHGQEGATFGSEAARNDAARGAGELFVQVMTDKALLANAHDNVERRQAKFALVQKLVDAGLRPDVDVIRARVDVVAAEQAVHVAEAQLSLDRATLTAAIGLDPSVPVNVVDMDLEPLALPHSADEAGNLAQQCRAELGQAHASVAASHDKLTQAGRARLPTLSMNASGQVSRATLLQGQGMPGNTYQAGGALVARWSALDVTTWRNVGVARQSLRALEVQRNAVSLRVRTEAVQAFFTHDKAQASYEQFTQVLASAAQALGAQSERYRMGIASLLELLDAQNIEQQVRGNLILAQRDVNLARVRLLAACGMLGRQSP